MKKKFSTIPKAIFHSAVFVIFYILIDYYNVPAKLHIDVSRINTDFLSITANALIAIIIFALGYYLVEQWNLKKLKNQKAVAECRLLSIYKECLSTVYLLDMPQAAKNLFDQTLPDKRYNILDDPSPAMKVSEIAFMDEPELMPFFQDGILTKAQLVVYMEIKGNFKSYVSTRVILYDAPQSYRPLRQPLINMLQEQILKYKEV